MGMTQSRKLVQTLVIGGGIAGTVAALVSAQGGESVVMVGQKPGGTAQWSGVADVFGSVQRDPATGEAITGEGERLASLLQRRRRHPYGVLGMRTAAEVEVYWGRAAQLLGGLVEVSRRGWCVTGLGMPRWADGASPVVAPGVVAPANAAGDAIGETVFVGLEGFSGLDAMQAAATYNALGKSIGRARGVCLSLGVGVGAWDEEPSAIARWIEGMSGEAFVERFKATITQTQSAQAQTRWLFPAVLGRDLATAQGLLGALSAALLASGISGRVAELPGMDRSLHGWRLHVGLQEKLAQVGNIERIGKNVEALREVSGHVEVVLRGGDVLQAERVLLATGRFVGGGLPRSGPWREPLTGAPLYLDGQPIGDAGGSTSRLLSANFLDDHPLMRVGVGVSPEGRILDAHGQALSPFIYAVGSMLEGTSHGDGCAMGVAVCTALRVTDALLTA